MSLSAGTRLGPHEILAPLGAGGMGEVYRARDPRMGRDVATWAKGGTGCAAQVMNPPPIVSAGARRR